MEMGSDEEDQIKNGNENKKKKIDTLNNNKKRQMKTPFQLQTLEKVYSEETYPSEATRAELSVKLDLSDRQLQMWFCHRRLKDKKDGQAKKPAAPPPPAAAAAALSSLNELPAADDGSGSGSGSGCSPYSESRRNVASGSSSSRDEVDEYEQPRLSVMVRRAVACIEGQLGEPLREDGPVLGMEFDPLPPGAFGTPIGMEEHQGHPYESKMYEPHDVRPRRPVARSFHAQQSLDDPSSYTSEMYGRYSESQARGMDYETSRSKSSSHMHGNGRSYGIHGNASLNCSTSQQDMPSPIVPSPHGDSFLMERKLNDGRVGRGSGQKDPEKLEIQRKKYEERMKKEMERHERERRKEEERLMRERIKEEEKLQREQRREMERREKFLQRENERAEKQKQKDEIRRERDAIRRKIAIEKATARRIARESMDLIEDEQQ